MESLVFQGIEVRRQDEMLCLTDMWHAAGSDPSKQPYAWLRLDAARDFLEYIAASRPVPGTGRSIGFVDERIDRGAIIAPRSADLIVVDRGGSDGGKTWAHWQVAMAYAKYLSHAFHAWCNEVVRAFMEGRLVEASPASRLPPSKEHLRPFIEHLPFEVQDKIIRLTRNNLHPNQQYHECSKFEAKEVHRTITSTPKYRRENPGMADWFDSIDERRELMGGKTHYHQGGCARPRRHG